MPAEINPYNAGTMRPSGSPFAPSAGEVSEVAYELDIDDMIAFSTYHLGRSVAARRGRRRVTVLFLLLAAVFCLLGLGAVPNDAYGATLFFSMAGTFLLLTFISPPLARRRMRRAVANLYREGSNRALLGPRRLRLSPSGIRHSSELIETTAKWAAVEKIETNEQYACLYIAAAQAYIVPRRAFSDEAQFLSFVELARRYRQQAGANTPT